MHIIIRGGAINPIPTPWGNFWVTPESPYALWLVQLQLECVVVYVVVVFLFVVVVVVTPAIIVVVISSVFVVNYVVFQNMIKIQKSANNSKLIINATEP